MRLAAIGVNGVEVTYDELTANGTLETMAVSPGSAASRSAATAETRRDSGDDAGADY